MGVRSWIITRITSTVMRTLSASIQRPEAMEFYFSVRCGTIHRKNLWLSPKSSPLLSSGKLNSLSGFQSPMPNVFETIRVPGFKSLSGLGRSFQVDPV